MVTKEIAYENALLFYGGDDLQADVWINKYCMNDGVEFEASPRETYKRVAKAFAKHLTYPEAFGNDPEQEIYDLFLSGRITPQGSPLSAIGNKYNLESSSNCFLIKGPEDSYEDILRADNELVQLMKRRGGVGLNLNSLRPKNTKVNNAARTSSGAVSFANRFSNTTGEVAQKGRRGALMVMMNVHHPDIKEFINCKRDQTKVRYANISIQFSDEFMDAVKSNENYLVSWPLRATKPTVSHELSAKEVFDEFIDAAWSSAEPGAYFEDNVMRDIYYAWARPEGTNPCGEIPLPPYDSCRLLLLNVHAYLEYKNEAYCFKREDFCHDIYKAQVLNDTLVDIEIDLIDQILSKLLKEPNGNRSKEFEMWAKIRGVAASYRRTGLGLTGVGDACAYLNFTYGDEDSINFVEDIYRELAVNAFKASVDLACKHHHFSGWDKNETAGWHDRVIACLDKEYQDKYQKYGRRNICLLTTPPAGSMSILLGVSSGIEPVPFLEYERRRKVTPSELQTFDKEKIVTDAAGDQFIVYTYTHPAYLKWLKQNPGAESHPWENSLAHEIDWVSSVKLMAAAQKWIDQSISKTINVPANATREDVKQVYLAAHEMGCKGLTIYREGSRDPIISKIEKFKYITPLKRPERLQAQLLLSQDKVVVLGLYEGKPYEVFGGADSDLALIIRDFITSNDNKSLEYAVTKVESDDGSKYILSLWADNVSKSLDDFPLNITFKQFESGLTRLISMSMHCGLKPNILIGQLQKFNDDRTSSVSFINLISRALKPFIEDGDEVMTRQAYRDLNCETPSQCKLVYSEKCTKCMTCGMTKC